MVVRRVRRSAWRSAEATDVVFWIDARVTASVRINPGTMVFARTPRFPSLVATYIVKVCTPDFGHPVGQAGPVTR